jgi:hypothetical protein
LIHRSCPRWPKEKNDLTLCYLFRGSHATGVRKLYNASLAGFETYLSFTPYILFWTASKLEGSLLNIFPLQFFGEIMIVLSIQSNGNVDQYKI